jgi:hypothetical protein
MGEPYYVIQPRRDWEQEQNQVLVLVPMLVSAMMTDPAPDVLF